MQSGAFEIYINGELEFSKLNSGRLPQFEEIQSILAKYKIFV